MKLAWALFALALKPGTQPFVALHLVDASEPTKPRCPDADASPWQPHTASAAPYMQACCACLAIAEWEMNRNV